MVLRPLGIIQSHEVLFNSVFNGVEHKTACVASDSGAGELDYCYVQHCDLDELPSIVEDMKKAIQFAFQDLNNLVPSSCPFFLCSQ